MVDEIRRIADDDGGECWERVTDEPELRGVDASFDEELGVWSVGVSVMEFVRDEPLEARMRDAIGAALRSVPGVTSVGEEDREVWVVAGQPSGEELARAAANVVDGLAEEARASVEGD